MGTPRLEQTFSLLAVLFGQWLCFHSKQEPSARVRKQRTNFCWSWRVLACFSPVAWIAAEKCSHSPNSLTFGIFYGNEKFTHSLCWIKGAFPVVGGCAGSRGGGGALPPVTLRAQGSGQGAAMSWNAQGLDHSNFLSICASTAFSNLF